MYVPSTKKYLVLTRWLKRASPQVNFFKGSVHLKRNGFKLNFGRLSKKYGRKRYFSYI